MEQQFNQLRQWLKSHRSLWESEILDHYPALPSGPYSRWTSELQELELGELVDFENARLTSGLSKEFTDFLLTIKRLTKIEKINCSDSKLGKNLQHKISQKKRHEITQLKGHFENDHKNNFVELGGGAAHLCAALLEGNQRKALSIDQEQTFQKMGQKKLKKYNPDIYDRIEFRNHKITRDTIFELPSNTVILGLHTCGPLANYHMNLFHKSQADHMLNFGCCYHKLKNEFNISQQAKEDPIDLTHHALHIADKTFKGQTAEGMKRRFQVKKFRYAFHIFLHQKIGQNFLNLGSAHHQEYYQEFSTYALNTLKRIHYAHSFDPEELDSFYSQTKLQEDINHRIHMGLLRNTLGRVIELYIIFDRALYLQDLGYRPKVLSFFNEEISPRNIGILI